MGFITFIGGIIILVVLLNLRSRVQRLEQIVKGNANQSAPETNQQLQPQQIKTQQSTTTIGPLLEYIEKQIRQGVTKEKITEAVLAAGWKKTDINNAFNSLSASGQLNQPSSTTSAIGPNAIDAFVDWLKEDWMLKLGALLLLIGFGWLTTYAFLNNWIGPMGRISLGIVAGVIFIILGWWRINRYLHQGGIFLVLGSTIVLLTIFAAREIYDFFTPLSALIVMFLSTTFVALASVKYRSQSLALASLILAGLAPLLTNSPTNNYTALFSYLLVITLGTIWIVVLTGKRDLTAAAIILITFYSLPHFFGFTSFDQGILLLFAYAFATIFFLTNTVGILKLKGKEIVSDLVTATGNGLLLLAWIMTAAQDEWKSLIIATWMIVFAVGAFIIFKITQRREPFYVYAGIGIAMLAAATAAELNGAALTVAYTIESAIIALITYLVLKDITIAERISLLMIGPVILAFNSIASRAWFSSVLHKDFFVLLILALTLLALGWFFLPYVRQTQDREPKQLNATLLIAGSVYVYVLLWLSLHAKLQNNNTAVMIALVIYTIIGLITYFYGSLNQKNSLRLYGGVIIGFVVGRLLLVDVWRMELAGRIVTFFLVGALLVSTAFFGKKNKKKQN